MTKEKHATRDRHSHDLPRIYPLHKNRTCRHDQLVYHVSGKFGTMTDDFTDTGRLIQKTTYHHITKPKLEKICSHSQNMHQKYMFEYSGVSPDSQEAYELAVKGMIRPLTPNTPPILYGIKCIEFEPPDFTLEIHSINENCDYLCSLIHDIGLHLKSSAVATKVRRVRYGFFHLEHALTFTQWHYDSILENIDVCRKLLTPENLLMTHTLTAQNESPSHGNKPTKLLQSPKSIQDLNFMRKRTRKQLDHQSKEK
ncbi:hypothetical protein FSP39_007673 [Pinctada imbricata]|uniref:Pseudouridine synthase II N-terminal domain-containing protein n=1 Tax=Pinctada imbricata TaxID=66713 RepID=A0AA88XS38_PINIB|nr:hypothetical protein FSP39_007673 [Pinctada imbricata]